MNESYPTHRVIVAEALVKVQIKRVVSTNLLRDPTAALRFEIHDMEHDLTEPITIDPRWVEWRTEPHEVFDV